MAGSKTGSKSIWKHSRKIAQLYQKYGASDINTITSEGTVYGDCVRALITCVLAVLAADDFPLEIDYTAGGPEDLGPP
jgi:hypothetical protein